MSNATLQDVLAEYEPIVERLAGHADGPETDFVMRRDDYRILRDAALSARSANAAPFDIEREYEILTGDVACPLGHGAALREIQRRFTQSASAPSAITSAEPCQRHGCRFHVAQDLLHLAQERGELAETEISSVTSSASATRTCRMQDGPPIPWALAEAIWKGYAKLGGDDQPLEVVDRRGGFGWDEVAYIWKHHEARRAIEAALPYSR